MKFAHIADCHVGSWREPKMRDINYKSFSKAIDEIIVAKVDFLLVAGDLFNTSFPPIDALKLVIQKFKQLKNANIPIYYIAGSHDFSPSGKTMLDVIEEAELATDVMRGTVDEEGKLHLKFTLDKKTGAKITGIIGKRGMLDKKYYESLYREELEKEEGFKIFMFHTTISELKPKHLEKMEGSPISFLPKNFDYYAGGHVHIVKAIDIEGYKNVVYPGPTYPNSFSEIEELNGGSYYIYDNGEMLFNQVKIIEDIKIELNCKNKSSEQVEEELSNLLNIKDVKDKVITIRLKGKLDHGKLTDINFKTLFNSLYAKGAYFIMKNTNAVRVEEFEEIKINTDSVDEIEEKIISENIGQINIGTDIEKEKDLTKKLINALDSDKNEGEKNSDYEKRVKEDANKILNLIK